MNTLSLKFWFLFISIIVMIIAGSQRFLMVQPLENEPKSLNVSLKHPVEETKTLKTRWNTKQTKSVKFAADTASKKTQPTVKTNYRPAPTILRESYEPEQMEVTLDDEWDEEAYTAAYLEKQANMSHEERAAQETIFALDDQMMELSEDFEQDGAMYSQVKQFFHNLDEVSTSKIRFLDLQCSNAICRLAVKVSDTNSQYELMENRINEMDLFEQSYAEVKVKNDDSRIVILYLS